MNIIISAPCSSELKIKVERVNMCVDNNNMQMYKYYLHDLYSSLKEDTFIWRYPSGKLKCVPAGNPIIDYPCHVELPNISISYKKDGNFLVEL